MNYISEPMSGGVQPDIPGMPHINLHDYQKVVRNYIINHPYCGVFLDIGLGKTLTTLAALKEMDSTGHILVISTPTIAKSTWINEIEDWGFDIRTESLVTGPRGGKLTKDRRNKKIAKIPTDPQTMYFISRDLIGSMIEELPKKRIPAEKPGYYYDVPVWPFSTVVIDESQGYKNAESKRFEAMLMVRPAMSRLIELTGTPAPNGLRDLWAPIYLLDGGEALGDTMNEYDERYFVPTAFVENHAVKWKLRPGAREEIYDKIKHLVISVENTKLKLPDCTINDMHVVLDPPIMEQYKQFKKESVLELVTEKYDDDGELIGYTISPPNAAVLAGKLIQYASGTIYVNEDHDYEIIHNEKMELTDYILRNTDSPVLIAYRYKSEKAELLKQLKQRGHQVTPFNGSRAMVGDWNAGKIPVMLIHPASAGAGLNLQHGGHTLIWYTLPDSTEQYNQTNGRINRQGQKHPVMIHRLITTGTRDAKTPLIHASNTSEERRLKKSVQVDVEEVLTEMGKDVPFLI